MEKNTKKTETVNKSNSRSLAVIIIVVVAVCIAVVAACAIGVYFLEFKKPDGSTDKNAVTSSDNSSVTETQKEDSSISSSSDNASSEKKDDNDIKSENNNDSSQKNDQSSKLDTPEDESSKSDNSNRSASPKVSVASQVANGVCVVGGFCSVDTEYITVSGKNVVTTKIYPYVGNGNSYFLGQVIYSAGTELEITATEKGKDASRKVKRSITAKSISQSYMETSEYAPYIGKNSQMHFYSALLSYSLSSGKVSDDIRRLAENNIGSIIEMSKQVGAEPIFLIIPSSADIYPETVPDNYKETSGERLYEVFSKIATNKGAKVFYPINTMKGHRNDGVGMRIYPHTDSHWTTYGAYWGTYDMMNYIAATHPAAAPRSLSQMGFYTTEMYGGDALFNFPKNTGFENERAGGKATVTGIKEVVPLYSLKMPTSTLYKVYNSNGGLYLTEDNAAANTVTNPNGAGLPTALIMRDSFGKVCYDMINDRFSTVYWEKFGNYNLPVNKLYSYRPNYVLYIFSERNLLKIMLNDSNANILILK